MKIRNWCTILIIMIMTITCIGCDSLGEKQELLDTTCPETGDASETKRPVSDTKEEEESGANETSETHAPVLDEEAPKPYASDTIEKFLLDWASAHTVGIDQCEYEYRYLLCKMHSDGGYYVNTPVIVNENYFLRRVYVHDSVYKYVISPLDEINEPRRDYDYSTCIIVQENKSYGSFNGVLNQFRLQAENGTAVRHTPYGYSMWYTDFRGRCISIRVPDSLGIENFEQISNYIIFETYTLTDGNLTKVN